jgi:hypothetical protein
MDCALRNRQYWLHNWVYGLCDQWYGLCNRKCWLHNQQYGLHNWMYGLRIQLYGLHNQLYWEQLYVTDSMGCETKFIWIKLKIAGWLTCVGYLG